LIKKMLIISIALVLSTVFLVLSTAGREKTAIKTSDKQSKCSVSKASETMMVEKTPEKFLFGNGFESRDYT